MFMLLIVLTVQAVDIEDGQWVWYSFQFENITGGEVHDVSNNSRNGTIVPGAGTIEYVEDTGFMGGAYNLTSYSFPSPYIWSYDVPSGLTHNYQWNYANNTLCVWLYPVDLNHSSKENVIFSEATSSLNSLWFGYDTTATPRFTDEKLGNLGDTWENYTTMSINEWHHVCRICNGTHIRAYLDGVELLPASNTGGVETLNRPITIGNARYRAGYGITGMIDEFGAWQRELTQSEILQLYNNGTGYIPPAYVQCAPDWICSLYGECNTSDLQPCLDVTDQNACGASYTGDYSEFTLSCNYCSINPLDEYCVYTPSDMPGIATDVLGEAGIQFKVWIPLLLLGVAALVVAVAIGRFRGGEGLWQPR
jgi:hypothetical protein